MFHVKQYRHIPVITIMGIFVCGYGHDVTQFSMFHVKQIRHKCYLSFVGIAIT